MVVVTDTGERITCQTAEKGSSWIKLDGSVIFAGINDTSLYEIEDGEWSEPPKSEVEILREAVEALIAARLEV